MKLNIVSEIRPNSIAVGSLVLIKNELIPPLQQRHTRRREGSRISLRRVSDISDTSRPKAWHPSTPPPHTLSARFRTVTGPSVPSGISFRK
ncbi:hypothetical protein Zmor_023662 [Zophobas morio]|uniref:Uncharacterized protein n=1 Tax=Zophobas morio TaxID=2755281 RepID=A0AA38HYM4_9CUCU|nr:hypothetical protein Zmor_023662 [Zophobas morio]